MDNAPLVRPPRPVRPAPHPAGRHRRLAARPTSSTCSATACGSTSTSRATAGAPRTPSDALPARRQPRRRAGARPARQRHRLPGLVVAPARRRAAAAALRRPDGRRRSRTCWSEREQQPGRRDDDRVRAVDQVLPAGQAGGQAVDHQAALPRALRREGDRAPTSGAQTSFTTTYSYHHGYFDGAEREFRGFGRVEQVDAEAYGKFAAGNTNSPYITDDQTLYQPPVKTVTWYHTGAFLDRRHDPRPVPRRVLPQLVRGACSPATRCRSLGDFRENALPEPDLAAADLSADEWREALRACKGMMLRQEIYELDVDALAAGRAEAGQALLGRLSQLPHSAPAAAGGQPARGLPSSPRARRSPTTTSWTYRGRQAAGRHARPAHRPHAQPEHRRVRQHPAVGRRRSIRAAS